MGVTGSSAALAEEAITSVATTDVTKGSFGELRGTVIPLERKYAAVQWSGAQLAQFSTLMTVVECMRHARRHPDETPPPFVLKK